MEKTPVNEETLEQCSGGYKGDWRTVMACRNCSYDRCEWLGDYRNQGPFRCKECGQMTLYGTDKYYQG